MPKIKGAVPARSFKAAKNYDEKHALAMYGRALASDVGVLAATITRQQRIFQRLRDQAAKGTIAAAALNKEWNTNETEAIDAGLELGRKVVEAIKTADVSFFRELADAVEVLQGTKGEPVQKYLLEILFMFKTWPKVYQRNPTIETVAEILRTVFHELDDDHKADLRREVSRWCKMLGLEPAKGKSVRTGKHWRKISGQRLPPNVPVSVLLQAAYGKRPIVAD